MRVICLNKENLNVELSGTTYRIYGCFGKGGNSSAFFAEEIYKIVEEYPMPMEERNQLADFLSGIHAFADDKFISNLRDPGFSYTTNLADIGGQEKQRVRETICAEWRRTNPGYDISFFDEEGNLLCKADNHIKVLTVSNSYLEIRMDGTIARFMGEPRKKAFAALAASMMWLCPNERKATYEEFETYIKEFKKNYKTLPRKERLRIVFVDDRWKKLYLIR